MSRPLFDDLAEDGGFPPKALDSGADLDITPMIDVTFLLLIFFMVTSTMQGTPDVDVPPARFGVGTPDRDAVIVTVKAATTAGPGGTIELPGGRGATLDQVREEIEGALRDGKTRVIVRADREVPHGFVQEVIRTVDAVEGIEFFIEVRDPKSR